MKDNGLPHFENHMFGEISADDVRAGIEEYQVLKLSFMDDRIALNKSNLFAKAFTFWTNNKDTTGEPTFAAIIAAMRDPGVAPPPGVDVAEVPPTRGGRRASVASTELVLVNWDGEYDPPLD